LKIRRFASSMRACLNIEGLNQSNNKKVIGKIYSRPAGYCRACGYTRRYGYVIGEGNSSCSLYSQRGCNAYVCWLHWPSTINVP